MRAKQVLVTGAAMAVAVAVAVGLLEAQIAIPYTFTDGTVIKSSEVNGNFSALGAVAVTTAGAYANPAWITSLDAGKITGGGTVPAGAVMLFNLAACPATWVDFAAGQGRYLVGTPAGGTLAASVGTALTDTENRATGQHTHAITDPGHTHTQDGWNGAAGDHFLSDGAAGQNDIGKATGSATTGITITNAGAVAGTNAPYVQLKVCVKS
jgi:hypothetical protein